MQDQVVPSRLRAEHVALGYDKLTIIDDLSVAIPDGRVTAIVGPNGCGKSTLLSGLSRLRKPSGGAILLDGRAISSCSSREVGDVFRAFRTSSARVYSELAIQTNRS